MHMFQHLNSLDCELKLNQLTNPQAKELQTILKELGYYKASIDGIVGQKTIESFREFKKTNHQKNFDRIGKGSINLLMNLYREKSFIDLCVDKCKQYGLNLVPQIAYVLATVDHETNGTMKPVIEAYWLSEKWRKNNLRYYPYYGRGYVQITWKENYAKYSKILGLDLINNPDLVLKPDISLEILVHGFKNGTFTGKKLEDYINSNKVDFLNARRCINGLDKAAKIVKLAKEKYIPIIERIYENK